MCIVIGMKSMKKGIYSCVRYEEKVIITIMMTIIVNLYFFIENRIIIIIVSINQIIQIKLILYLYLI